MSNIKGKKKHENDNISGVSPKVRKTSKEGTIHVETSNHTDGNYGKTDRNDNEQHCIGALCSNVTSVNNSDSPVIKDIIKQKEECRTCRRAIIKNWKILKKYVYPVDLLEKLCVRTLLKRENFEDLNEIDRSLALDKVLTASYRSILTLEDFDKLKAAVNDANPGANVEWNANDDNEVPFVTVEIPTNNLVQMRLILEKNLKRNVVIDIKDDFLIHSIITIDEHEQIAQDLRKNSVSTKFLQMIIDKMHMRSFDCLSYSLQNVNEKQKNRNQSNIKTLLDFMCGPRIQSDSSNTRNSVDMIQGRMTESTAAVTGCKITVNLTNANQVEQPSFNENVEQNIENMTLHFVNALGSCHTKTDKGSVIIFLKSLENDMGKRIYQSLVDGSFVELLDKLFNDKAMITTLSKGKYKLEVTIEPYEDQDDTDLKVTECPPVNEMCSLPNLITANRSFLIDQINVITLLNAFNRETAEKFEKAGINEAIEITKKAEVFLDVVEKEGLYEAFYNNLQTKGMTYVLNRLQTCKKVCAAEYTHLRRNIIQKFGLLVSSIDIDDIKETFVERKVFEISTFDKLEGKFEGNKEQAIAAFLIEVLKSGRKAVVTLVDVLYMNTMDSLATELLKVTVDQPDVDMKRKKSEGLLFEGTFQVIVKEADDEELYSDNRLEKDRLDDKVLVRQEYKRFLKDTKIKNIEISEEMFDPKIQKERENFYRHSTVVIDLGKEALMMLLKYELSKSGVKFVNFLAANRHDLYHCVYTTCCRCQYYKPKQLKGVSLSVEHLETILDKTGLKLEKHRHGNLPQLCCSPVKKVLTIDQLDFVLLKVLLASLRLQYDVQKAVDNIETCRNESFYKADVARLEYVQYLEFKREIQDAILTVCRYCNTEEEMTKKLKDVMLKPMDMTSLYRRQNKILDAVEEITDVKIRNRVEEKVGEVEFQTSISETECQLLCGKYFDQQKDDLISLQATLQRDQPRSLGKRYFHRKNKRGSLRNEKYTFHPPLARTSSYFKTFIPSTIRLWNSLPLSLQKSPSLGIFRSGIDKFNRTDDIFQLWDKET